MTTKTFEVEITITKFVKVRVPSEVLEGPPYGTAEDAAEEFALGGKSSWPEYVISEDEDYDVESVREIKEAEAA